MFRNRKKLLGALFKLEKELFVSELHDEKRITYYEHHVHPEK